MNIAVVELLCDVSDEIILAPAPVRRDQQTQRRFTEQAFNYNAGIQSFDEIREQIEIFLILQHPKRLARILRCQRRSADDVQMMNLERVDPDACRWQGRQPRHDRAPLCTAAADIPSPRMYWKTAENR